MFRAILNILKKLCTIVSPKICFVPWYYENILKNCAQLLAPRYVSCQYYVNILKNINTTKHRTLPEIRPG